MAQSFLRLVPKAHTNRLGYSLFRMCVNGGSNSHQLNYKVNKAHAKEPATSKGAQIRHPLFGKDTQFNEYKPHSLVTCSKMS